ncbi:MAG: 4-hydroxy-tetrahydrodipicolinate synthase [Chlamydiae bacterium]|nr:4-hydroxy-tetrahydrodipicolinate synthase [Chlamydiota bacterium]
MFKGSMVALVTPFTEKGKVDEKAFRNLVEWHIFNKTDGIICGGTTGESPTLDDKEKIKLIKTCVEMAKNKCLVIAGTGTNSTQKSLELTAKAKELGVDGALIIVPYYNRPTQQGCIEHFKVLSKANIPLIVYHHPGRTGVKLLPQTFQELQKLSNIVAIKEAAGDMNIAKEIKDKTTLPMLSGDDGLNFDLMKEGCVGVISVLGNVIPKELKQMISYCLEKKFDEAKKIHEKYLPLTKSLFLETNPQCVKYALFLMNKCKAGMRLPLIEPSDPVKDKIKAALHSLELI